MSTRVNSAAIGAFVVGAIVLLLVALLVWGGTGLFRSKLTYVLFFMVAGQQFNQYWGLLVAPTWTILYGLGAMGVVRLAGAAFRSDRGVPPPARAV